MTPRCHHWRAPVRVGETRVLCSAWDARPLDRPPIEWRPYPAGAYYLDPLWRDGLPAASAWPFIVVAWPDMGVIPIEQLRTLTEEIAAIVNAGTSVEIGCLGGHGRTGTLLAALIARVEGRTAAEAFLATRERYCVYAIETSAQAELIYAASGEPPPPPDAFRQRD